MADSDEITNNLLAMYGRDDWIMRWNFRVFLNRSGLAALPKESRILDFGCAMGHFLHLLRTEGFTHVTGLDASEAMVSAARTLIDCPIVLGDATQCGQLFPRHSADVIIVSDLVHHIETKDGWNKLLTGCHQIVRPGGLLVIREPWPTPILRLLQRLSRYPVFHVGPLKERLQSFVEEAELLDHFFAHWPPHYQALLQKHGFQIEQDFSWLVHRITTACALSAP